MAKVHDGEEISPIALTPRVGRTNVKETDRQQTDGFAMANIGRSRSDKNMRFVRYI